MAANAVLLLGLLAIDYTAAVLICRFHNSLQMALAAGDSEKVAQGLYENYLEAKVKDPRMEAVSGI